MSKKYRKLCQLWQNDAFYKGPFPEWLDKRRDERKALKKKQAHDYTPHPWSEPVPEDGEYLVFSIKYKSWTNYDLKKGTTNGIDHVYSHWMHMPPVPEVK